MPDHLPGRTVIYSGEAAALWNSVSGSKQDEGGEQSTVAPSPPSDPSQELHQQLAIIFYLLKYTHTRELSSLGPL